MKLREIKAQRAGSLGREGPQNNPPKTIPKPQVEQAELKGVWPDSLQISVVVFRGSLIFSPISQKTRAATVANLVTLPVASMGELVLWSGCGDHWVMGVLSVH